MSDDALSGSREGPEGSPNPEPPPPWQAAPPAYDAGGPGAPSGPGPAAVEPPHDASGQDPAAPGGSAGVAGSPPPSWFGSPPPSPPATAPPRGEAETAEEPELIESLLTIWTAPRATIRRIIEVEPGFWVNRIAALVGLVFAIGFWNSAANAGLAETEGRVSPGLGIMLSVLLWPPLMIVGLYFSAWLMRITGAWLLDGKAESRAIRTALAWSYMPLLMLLPLALLAPVLSRASTGGNFAATSVLLVFGLLYVTASIWCLVIQCKGVAEVQGYRSAWKGLLNIMLPGLIFFGIGLVLLIVVGVVGALAGLGS